MSSLRLEVVREPQALAPFLSFWRAQAPTPLQSPEWMLAWWEAFASPNSQLSVAIVSTETGEVVGLAPFYLRDDWGSGRSLRFLGSGRACGDFQTLISATGFEAQVGMAVGRWLIDFRDQIKWGFIELEGITQADTAVGTLVETLKLARCWQHTSELEHTWRLDLSGGWQGFLNGLSKTQRRQTRNWVNRFDKSEHWRLHFVDAPEAIPTALAQCIDLHQKRWIAAGEPGCFANAKFKRFVENACRELAQERRVHIAFFEDDGKPIACHLYASDAMGNRYMYQSGRDPQRDSDSVGRILNSIVIRHACREGVGHIDFLRGDEIYKQRLGATPTACLRLRLAAPALLPRARHGLRTIGRSVKHRAKSLRANWTRLPIGDSAQCNAEAKIEG